MPTKVCSFLIRANPTAEQYHQLRDALECQDWILALEIIRKDPPAASITDPLGENAMDAALRFGAPTRVLEHIASALPASRGQVEEEAERRGTLSTWSGRGMEEVERFVERVSSGLAKQINCPAGCRDEHKHTRMEWDMFERESSKIVDPSQRWWQGIVPIGLEAVADRAGVKASELVDGTQAEVDARRLEVRTQVMEGDKQLLETLCQRGALRPAEMKHSIDASITGVDDEASFWQLENVRSALAIDYGAPFATTPHGGLMPLQWAVKCRAPMPSLELLISTLQALEEGGNSWARDTDSKCSNGSELACRPAFADSPVASSRRQDAAPLGGGKRLQPGGGAAGRDRVPRERRASGRQRALRRAAQYRYCATMGSPHSLWTAVFSLILRAFLSVF